ncbi:MAG: type II secretion system protein J [Chthoniobacterales bacterium]
MKKQIPYLLSPSQHKRGGFTLLEILLSAAIMALVLVPLASVISMISSSYSRTMGKPDIFESTRATLDVLERTLRQVTLQSYLSYDNPLRPANGIAISENATWSSLARSPTTSISLRFSKTFTGYPVEFPPLRSSLPGQHQPVAPDALSLPKSVRNRLRPELHHNRS